MNAKAQIFLTARWENLIIVSYKVEPGILLPHLPKGLELDTIDGSAFISLVAFNFNDTKVKGIKVPFHVNFPEINFRFYIKHPLTSAANEMRRGVVFIREFVPRYFISLFANYFFNENYRSVKMKSSLIKDAEKICSSYEIHLKKKIYRIEVDAENKPFLPDVKSAGHFFKEHEWGFGPPANPKTQAEHSSSPMTGQGRTAQGDTFVYRVEHPFWEVYHVLNFEHNIDFCAIYGQKWKLLNDLQPYNVVFAKGSRVKVFSAEKL